MMTRDEKNTMRSAIDEIQALRRENEILSAKVGVMDLFGSVFRAQPAYRSRAEQVDPLWHLQRCLDEAEKEEKRDHEPSAETKVKS